MKRIGLALFGIILAINTSAQNKKIHVNREVSEYYVDTCLFSQIDFHYFNCSGNVLVLWFDENRTDTVTYNQKIKNKPF